RGAAPDAIFAINDNIAASAMHVAKKMGMDIPNDISIVGFDDEPHSLYFSPALSTVWQPVYSLGMLSARILLQRIKNKNSTEGFRVEIFKPELVVRASSRKVTEGISGRSEEHTSELQSRENLVCRLLL